MAISLSTPVNPDAMQMNKFLTDFSLKGVVAGLVVVWLGSFLAIVIIGSVAGVFLYGAVGADAFDNVLSWQFLLINFLVSLLFAALGGQVAATLAGKGVFLNSGLVGVAFALIIILTISDQYVWYSVSLAVLSVPAALAGGWNTTPAVKAKNA